MDVDEQGDTIMSKQVEYGTLYDDSSGSIAIGCPLLKVGEKIAVCRHVTGQRGFVPYETRSWLLQEPLLMKSDDGREVSVRYIMLCGDCDDSVSSIDERQRLVGDVVMWGGSLVK